jgi:hypothetical protein
MQHASFAFGLDSFFTKTSSKGEGGARSGLLMDHLFLYASIIDEECNAVHVTIDRDEWIVG